VVCFGPHLTHSNLPAGRQLSGILIPTAGGTTNYAFREELLEIFHADANGENSGYRLNIQRKKSGAIARGGVGLPGLRTTAWPLVSRIKRRLPDSSSARGKSNFIPNPANETVTTFDVTSEELKKNSFGNKFSNLITAQYHGNCTGRRKRCGDFRYVWRQNASSGIGEQRGKQTDGNGIPIKPFPRSRR